MGAKIGTLEPDWRQRRSMEGHWGRSSYRVDRSVDQAIAECQHYHSLVHSAPDFNASSRLDSGITVTKGDGTDSVESDGEDKMGVIPRHRWDLVQANQISQPSLPFYHAHKIIPTSRPHGRCSRRCGASRLPVDRLSLRTSLEAICEGCQI